MERLQHVGSGDCLQVEAPRSRHHAPERERRHHLPHLAPLLCRQGEPTGGSFFVLNVYETDEARCSSQRNVLNQWFVKRSWGWVTAIFIAFNLAVLAFPSSPTGPQKPSPSTPTIVNGRNVPSTRLAVPSAHLFASLRRYLLASLVWFYLTQATWFGSTLGPSIAFRILRSSGAVCVPSAIASDPLSSRAAGGGLHADGLADPAGPPMVCTGAKGEYWRGGHDVSGHAFMMVHCSLFLLELVYPLLPALFPAFFTGGTTRAGARVHPAIKLVGYAAVVAMALAWWMLLMTSLFFHSPAEKLTGTAFGILGWYLSSL